MKNTGLTLFVIGNGFDLHHGIKSSFGDFRDDYLIEHAVLSPDIEKIIRESDFLQHNMGQREGSRLGTKRELEFHRKNGSSQEIINILEEMTKHPFEAGHAYFPPDGARLNEIMEISPFLTLVAICLCIDPMDDTEWNKFESILSNGSYRTFYQRTCAGDLNQLDECGLSDDRNIKHPNRLLRYFHKEILYHFPEWISRVDSSGSVDKIGKKLNIEKDNAIFLNFNYTRTLEKVYDVNHERICYIHGSVNDMNDIHIGKMDYNNRAVSEYLVDSHENMYDRSVAKAGYKNYAVKGGRGGSGITMLPGTKNYGYWGDLRNAKLAIKKFSQSLDKNSNERISKYKRFFDQQVSEIVVIGHSLCLSDEMYFKRIQSVNPSVKWIVSYYDDLSLQELKKNAQELGLRNIEWKHIDSFHMIKEHV
ncbi:MAG: hypothetical protein P857_826 [Candidatus Xenolissoclinum pacificiensis L6]|uniref:Bacteriophage abortive infection AbiH n=1 Tax=Candidatus Xenolissoclinum pacificiensis L6 TaxID=1401685 RepID=W2UZR2_9RICK|nr:MAG: hypothetical protein P857_826 [Candidatus Xenolissoclinum pacificiensis L6]